MRFAQVIIFLLEKEYELAQNEIRNINKAIQFRKNDDLTFIRQMAALFDSFISLVTHPNDKKGQKEKLLLAMDDYKDQYFAWTIDVMYYPLLWLKSYLEAKLESNKK